MTFAQPLSWSDFFKTLKKITANDLLPYVTRLAQKKYPSQNQKAFAILIATLLSLRTRDAVTESTSENLFKLGKTPQALLKFSETQIAKTIYPSAFYKTKAKQILKICKLLITKFNGKVPQNLDDLLTLPGIGRKTANLVLTEGFDQMGICVDTHVHRILNRIGFIKTNSADDTEMVLRNILPKLYWKKINLKLVMFGQYHCLPRNPKCQTCLLNSHCHFKQ